MQTILRCLSLLALGPLAVSQAQPVTDETATDETRIAVYREFRQRFDAGDYQAALPIAENLVSLTQKQFGDADRALVNPLANVGTTQLKLANHAAAEASYLRAVELLERSASNTDRLFIAPLHGLGATYLAAKRPGNAVTPLKRAVDLSRNLDGLYNDRQLPIVRQLIDAYVATGNLADAEKEHNYAYAVAETSFGNNDPRMLDAHERLAGWYDFVGRYSSARSLYERSLALIDRLGKRTDLRKVAPLRGIARTYQLEFLYGAEKTEEALDAFGRPVTPFANLQAGRMQDRGERALEFALQIITTNEPVDHRLHGETLADLGDWRLVSGATDAAKLQYGKAWEALTLAGDTTLLQAPRQLAYRPSPLTVGRSRLDPAEATEQPLELRFSVTSEGRVRGVTATPTELSDSIVRSVSTALGRARYAPRIENGVAVDTDNVALIERVLVRNPPPQADQSASQQD